MRQLPIQSPTSWLWMDIIRSSSTREGCMNEFSLREDDKQRKPAAKPGKLPFKPGELLMHDSETKDLKAFNWQPGDPVPPDFARKLAEARREVDADIKSGKLHGVDLN